MSLPYEFANEFSQVLQGIFEQASTQNPRPALTGRQEKVRGKSPRTMSSCRWRGLALSMNYFFFFFFDFLYMPPPGFSFRAICMYCVVDDDLIAAVSVTDVEPAAWADSDKATRPAAPRSAVRTNDFIAKTSWLIVQRHMTYASENELEMN